MYILYATTKNGEGFVKEIGRYKDIEDIEIICGMFSPDVRITIEQENDEQNNA